MLPYDCTSLQSSGTKVSHKEDGVLWREAPKHTSTPTCFMALTRKCVNVQALIYQFSILVSIFHYIDGRTFVVIGASSSISFHWHTTCLHCRTVEVPILPKQTYGLMVSAPNVPTFVRLVTRENVLEWIVYISSTLTSFHTCVVSCKDTGPKTILTLLRYHLSTCAKNTVAPSTERYSANHDDIPKSNRRMMVQLGLHIHSGVRIGHGIRSCASQ